MYVEGLTFTSAGREGRAPPEGSCKAPTGVAGVSVPGSVPEAAASFLIQPDCVSSATFSSVSCCPAPAAPATGFWVEVEASGLAASASLSISAFLGWTAGKQSFFKSD